MEFEDNDDEEQHGQMKLKIGSWRTYNLQPFWHTQEMNRDNW